MANIPTPSQVEEFLGDIEHSVIQIREQWRWAAPSIYDRPRRGGVNPTSTKPPDEHHLKPHSKPPGSFSDPTGGTMAQSEKFRRLARNASRKIVAGRNSLQAGVADLNDAMLLLDPPAGPEVADIRAIVSSAGSREIAQATAAQARRERRAAGSGNWDEVTG